MMVLHANLTPGGGYVSNPSIYYPTSLCVFTSAHTTMVLHPGLLEPLPATQATYCPTLMSFLVPLGSAHLGATLRRAIEACGIEDSISISSHGSLPAGLWLPRNHQLLVRAEPPVDDRRLACGASFTKEDVKV